MSISIFICISISILNIKESNFHYIFSSTSPYLPGQWRASFPLPGFFLWLIQDPIAIHIGSCPTYQICDRLMTWQDRTIRVYQWYRVWFLYVLDSVVTHGHIRWTNIKDAKFLSIHFYVHLTYYAGSGAFLPSHNIFSSQTALMPSVLYVIRIHDSYLYKLGQHTSSNDEYKIQFHIYYWAVPYTNLLCDPDARPALIWIKIARI